MRPSAERRIVVSPPGAIKIAAVIAGLAAEARDGLHGITKRAKLIRAAVLKFIPLASTPSEERR